MPWDETPGSSKPKKTKTHRRYGKSVLAAALALLLVAGSAFGTASIVNSRWEERLDKLTSRLESQIAGLQSDITKLQQSTAVGTGISVSGTATADGMTPGQVYAQNVRSVVAIAANQQSTNFYGQISETASSGSGFILTEDGYVVTNHHVIEDAYKLTVITYDGTEYDAKLVGANETNDIAVLKIEGTDFPAVTIGRSCDLIVGDMVVAIGNPLGELTSTQTVGYVSAKDRTISVDGTVIDMIQTDAAINSGNSGGPLFNMHGEVVGITSAKYSGNSGSGATIEGIGFAIPIDDVIGMIADLKEYGYITGAYLGITLYHNGEVKDVTVGSCAEKAGLQSGDRIIGLGEYEVSSYTELARALRQFRSGETSTIRVIRNGEELDLPITFDERPHEVVTMPEQEVPRETAPNENSGMKMPSEGDFEEWFEFFSRFFGQDK